MATAAELVARARALGPAIADRAAQADAERRLPDATIRDLVDAELFPVMSPRRFGGHELGLGALVAVGRALGRACGSTAWVYSLLAVHHWLLALFPEAAQVETFAAGPSVLIPATFAPGGFALVQDDATAGPGHRVTGRWSFASGAHHASHFMVSAPVLREPGGPPVDARCLLLPRSAAKVEDTWFTSGMRGTGSCDVVIDGAFVPAHRSLSFGDVLQGSAPGASVHASALYRLPLVPVLCFTASGPALGIARGAVEAFRDRLGTRALVLHEKKQREAPAAQIRLGVADVEVAAAEALVERRIDELEAASAAGRRLSPEDRVRFRMDAAWAVARCKHAVTSVVEASGARAQFEGSPLARALRDVHTLAAHTVFDLDVAAELHGRALLGLPPNHPLV